MNSTLEVRCPVCQLATLLEGEANADIDCQGCGGRIAVRADDTIQAVPDWTEPLLSSIERAVDELASLGPLALSCPHRRATTVLDG